MGRISIEWPREQVALPEFTAEPPEMGELGRFLDTLRDDRHAEGTAERDDGSRERPFVRIVRLADEFLGDLEDIDPESAEVAQR